MTDKEQIMIDGVDITECVNCLRICMTTTRPEAICKEYGNCSGNNCLYKQLARKTRECEDLREALKEEIIYKRTYLKGLLDYKEECEELKEEIGKLQKSQFCVAYEKDCHKVCKQQNCAIKNSYSYRKALEEIEKYCIDQNLKYDYTACEILEIINKAKGEGND